MHGDRAIIVAASIAHVYLRFAHLVGDQAFDLLHLCSQRAAVIGISIEALRAGEPSTTTVYRDTYLVAKLILLAHVALGDALHFMFMHTVDLVLVMPLLFADSMRCLKQIVELRGWSFCQALDLSNNSPKLGFQFARAVTSAFHLASTVGPA